MPELTDVAEPDTNDEKQSTTTVSSTVSAASAVSGSRLPVVAVAISAAALGLAGWAVLRPSVNTVDARGESASAQGAFTDAQRSAATAKLCGAFETARKGVSSNTNATAPGGNADVAGSLAVAANARLSLFAGGQYLLQQIEPAAPNDLAGEARNLANTLISIGASAISGVPTSDPAQAENLKAAETLSANLSTRCAKG